MTSPPASPFTAANIIIDQVLFRVSQMLVDDDAAAKVSALHFKKKSAVPETSVSSMLFSYMALSHLPRSHLQARVEK